MVGMELGTLSADGGADIEGAAKRLKYPVGTDGAAFRPI
jgi:hypothetical protein